MQIAALWVSRPRPCLPLPRRHGVLVGGQHTPARLPHALHPCRLGGLGTLGTQLSFHLVAGSGSLDLGTPPWLPDYTNWLPKRPAHVHPHTASMRPHAHAWSHPPSTLRRRVRLPHHDDVVSLQDRLRPWASTKQVFDAITDGHFGVSPHGGFADLAGFIEACIRRGEIVDGVRRVDVVIGQVRGKTVSNPEHELEGVVVNVP